MCGIAHCGLHHQEHECERLFIPGHHPLVYLVACKESFSCQDPDDHLHKHAPEMGHLHLMMKLSSLYFLMIVRLIEKVKAIILVSDCYMSHPFSPATKWAQEDQSTIAFLFVGRLGNVANPSTLSPLSSNTTIGLSILGPSLLWRNCDCRAVARVQEGERMIGGTGMAKEMRDAIRDVRARHKSELGPAPPQITTRTTIAINGVIFIGGPAGYWVVWVRWNGESLQEQGCAGDVVHDVVYEECLECGGRTEHLDGATRHCAGLNTRFDREPLAYGMRVKEVTVIQDGPVFCYVLTLQIRGRVDSDSQQRVTTTIPIVVIIGGGRGGNGEMTMALHL
ncbi:hypothetical protein F5J12DRAFT_787652 [Pisolithus orientalis]|uniref:uncharacterized protein n=1 Tax=Pisolithus orientalis TaxID=936130 RepID=UPI0022245BFA|nr:uncharacterized protein F5J12DRAFT_787652 [Pisolithus orientalis]KAI5984123.1 hypothetical protein F5J12DRAFT_787652 [Pisolithus orientalis]